eukprot:TRINITY_DN7898_c0_g1_i3.p2 TRINITY_DN7898_c0_g1~~TRINITY_DN7898_c0_g1_i3.p2  ORF type:complete len:112 (-),score=12.37 TRINITY_DN7898_c0_g1_i3:5-340(-)
MCIRDRNRVVIQGKLEAGATYYLRMYCENLVGKVSEYKNISWMQVSNSGKPLVISCLLYTSDAADEEDSVDLGGCRIIKKKKISKNSRSRKCDERTQEKTKDEASTQQRPR